jgi:hypothetical protein
MFVKNRMSATPPALTPPEPYSPLSRNWGWGPGDRVADSCLAIPTGSMWAEWLRSAERYDASICSWVSVAGLCLCQVKNVFAFIGAFTSASVRVVFFKKFVVKKMESARAKCGVGEEGGRPASRPHPGCLTRNACAPRPLLCACAEYMGAHACAHTQI